MRTTLNDRRNRGERRWGLSSEFPLKDCNGVMVVIERRQLPDRRLENTTLADRLLMFSGVIPLDTGKKRH